MSIERQTEAGPKLRLLTAEEIESAGAMLGEGIRLSHFYFEWFRENALEGESASQGTIVGYDCTVGLWIEITKDPPGFDQFTISHFVKGLKDYRFTRSRSREGHVPPGAVWRSLSLDTQAKHLRNVRAIIHRMGPQRRPNVATAAIVESPPVVSVPQLEPEPKDCFELSRARQIIAAAGSFDRPRLDGISPWEFWRAYCGWLYVTDVREGTLWGFEWPMLVSKSDGWWLHVPRSLVPKTGKGMRIGMPDWCVQAVHYWPRQRATIFNRPHCANWLRNQFYELQDHAGVPAHEQFPPQVWRRTHAREMQRLGASYAVKVSQTSLQHSSSSTTTSHYADITEEIRRRLPPLWTVRARDPRQGELFDME
jgi:hypothetical protein